MSCSRSCRVCRSQRRAFFATNLRRCCGRVRKPSGDLGALAGCAAAVAGLRRCFRFGWMGSRQFRFLSDIATRRRAASSFLPGSGRGAPAPCSPARLLDPALPTRKRTALSAARNPIGLLRLLGGILLPPPARIACESLGCSCGWRPPSLSLDRSKAGSTGALLTCRADAPDPSNDVPFLCFVCLRGAL